MREAAAGWVLVNEVVRGAVAGAVPLQFPQTAFKLGVITEQDPGADAGCGASSLTQEGIDPRAAIV